MADSPVVVPQQGGQEAVERSVTRTYVRRLTAYPQVKAVCCWQADDITHLFTLIDARTIEEAYAVYRLQAEMQSMHHDERLLFDTTDVRALEGTAVDEFLGPQARQLFPRQS